jgi:hypothetical protein
MNPTETALLSVHVTEYSALRAQINALHATEGQIMNFSIALSGAFVAFAAKLNGTPDPLIFILAPFPFFLLGTFFGYTQIRVIQTAAYLNKDLRPRVISLLGQEDIWRWEFFRRNQSLTKCPMSGLANSLNLLRWLLFLWPVLLPVFLFFLSSAKTNMNNWRWFVVYADFLTCVILVIFAVYCSRRMPREVL